MARIGKKSKKTTAVGSNALLSTESSIERILAGIDDDASQEAASVIAEAEKLAAERVAFARQKARTILKEARIKAEEQAVHIRRTILSSLSIVLKREKIRAQDEVLQEIISRVRKKVATAITDPAYRAMLSNWIVEAAVGLGASKASVNTSAVERPFIDEGMLREATTRIASLPHDPVELSVSSDPPLAEQGIVLTAANGRTAFNNQISTRMRRMEQRIRNRVYDALFTDKAPPDRSIKESERT
jgi:vacuolar-type H+-ATPase subunit E/Vma4